MLVAIFASVFAGAVINSLIDGFSLLNITYILSSAVLFAVSLPAVSGFLSSRKWMGNKKMALLYALLIIITAGVWYAASLSDSRSEDMRITSDIDKSAAMVSEGKGREAVNLLFKYAESGNQNPYLHRNLAAAYVKSGNLEKAEEEYRILFYVDPARADNYFNYAVMLYAKKDYSEAKKYFIKSYHMAPSNWKACYCAAIAARLEGSLSESLYYLKLAEGLNSEEPDIQYMQAKVYYNLYYFNDARAKIDKALGMPLTDDKKQELRKMLDEINHADK